MKKFIAILVLLAMALSFNSSSKFCYKKLFDFVKSQNFENFEIPNVVLLKGDNFNAVYFKVTKTEPTYRSVKYANQILGVYYVGGDTVYVALPCEKANMESTLVHEFTHYAQFRTYGNEMTQYVDAMEHEAYSIEAIYQQGGN